MRPCASRSRARKIRRWATSANGRSVASHADIDRARLMAGAGRMASSTASRMLALTSRSYRISSGTSARYKGGADAPCDIRSTARRARPAVAISSAKGSASVESHSSSTRRLGRASSTARKPAMACSTAASARADRDAAPACVGSAGPLGFFGCVRCVGSFGGAGCVRSLRSVGGVG
ncbi:hypothetical protein D3C71_1419280 [compost metagenome]